jgi:hypothetical protein
VVWFPGLVTTQPNGSAEVLADHYQVSVPRAIELLDAFAAHQRAEISATQLQERFSSITIAGREARAYLNMSDIARAEGVDVATVAKWQDRFQDFPEPDIYLGATGKWPGWDPARLPEISEWRARRVSQGGRPRDITVDEAHTVGLPLAEWIIAGTTPAERTKRLLLAHGATESPRAMASLLDDAGIEVDNAHIRDLLTNKPVGNRAGDFARGLVFTAVTQHVQQIKSKTTFDTALSRQPDPTDDEDDAPTDSREDG